MASIKFLDKDGTNQIAQKIKEVQTKADELAALDHGKIVTETEFTSTTPVEGVIYNIIEG
jgi:hypothetical protein